MTSPSRSDMSELIDELESLARALDRGPHVELVLTAEYRGPKLKALRSAISRLKEASGGGEGRGLGSSRDHAPDTCAALEDALAERLADPKWLAKWNASEDDGRPFAEMLQRLRADEGDSVTLFGDNPDFNGQPNSAVECCGDWSDWQDRRFTGETLSAAVLAAFKARRDADALQCKTDPDAVPGMNNILIRPDKDGQSLTVDLCEGCPPLGYPTDKMRCTPCPRRVQPLGGGESGRGEGNG